MRERARVLMMTGLTLAAIVLTLTLTAAPTNASIALAKETRYSAGNLTAGTSICNCPVTVGNCVCAYTTP